VQPALAAVAVCTERLSEGANLVAGSEPFRSPSLGVLNMAASARLHGASEAAENSVVRWDTAALQGYAGPEAWCAHGCARGRH
jgi:hypothetical protein